MVTISGKLHKIYVDLENAEKILIEWNLELRESCGLLGMEIPVDLETTVKEFYTVIMKMKEAIDKVIATDIEKKEAIRDRS